ncbi:PREDICTED: fatty-acid-binding protein 1-like [Nicotiana attenuata]|uniref:Fatty-acid-binding protein 1 n=1 Tax=Nicotiana attenuata TaxID=49451 RepID=A0A1J6IF93_NICAT|nr:PREDICTED: fatty-acid-binding protein 1-like [Nicotiana attenuata]OIT03725.1 fatty-acid-binding protein 1 [Nicotiana attenuata]
MPSTMEDVTTKTEAVEIDPKTVLALNKSAAIDEKKISTEVEPKTADTETKKEDSGCDKTEEEKKEKCDQVEPIKEEEIPVETEPKTGVTFPVKLQDGKLLKAVGLRKKSMLGIGLKIYGFGIYADNEKMKELMQSKIGNKAPSKPTKEMYQMVIDSDFGMMVLLVIVFSGLSMSMVRKNFDEGLGAAIKKLTGGKNEELTKKIMGEASDDIKLTSGSVIEISRLPGFVLQTKVMGEIVSKVESELLCRAYIYMYLGEDPFDKEAKDKFGTSMLSMF